MYDKREGERRESKRGVVLREDIQAKGKKQKRSPRATPMGVVTTVKRRKGAGKLLAKKKERE